MKDRKRLTTGSRIYITKDIYLDLSKDDPDIGLGRAEKDDTCLIVTHIERPKEGWPWIPFHFKKDDE